MLRRFFNRLVQCMKCWGAGAITESSAPPPLWLFYFFAFAIIFTSVEVIGRLRFDEPLQGFVRTSVGKHTRAHFVRLQIQLAVMIW